MSDYAELSDLRHFLRTEPEDPETTTDDDAELALALTAASDAISLRCNRKFDAAPDTAVARYYKPFYAAALGRYVVDIDDLMDDDDLVVKSSVEDVADFATTLTEFTLNPVNAIADGKPWTRLVFGSGVTLNAHDLEITALWGWAEIPAPIVQATLLQAARIFKRRDAPFGIAGSPDMGSEMRLLSMLDPDVQVVLRPYIRWWGAV